MRTLRLLVPVALLAAACGEGKVIQEPVRPVLTQTVVPGASATSTVVSRSWTAWTRQACRLIR